MADRFDVDELSEQRVKQRIDAARSWARRYAEQYGMTCGRPMEAKHPEQYYRIACTVLEYAEQAVDAGKLSRADNACRYADELLGMVRRVLERPAISGGHKFSAIQSERAKKGRSDAMLKERIDSFAGGDNTAKELWPELYAALDMAGCDPEETATASDMRKWRIDYISADGRPRHITFGNFETKLTEARKS